MSAQKQDRYADYESVADRIDKFYERFPDGRIITTIVEHDAQSGFILMRAEIFRLPDDAQPSATGHAFEVRGEGYVQKTSYIEVCETSAAGRALAMLNFKTKKGIASREEMQKGERMGNQQRPSVAQGQSTPPPDLNAPPTPTQISEIKQIRLRLKINTPLDFSRLTYSTAEDALIELRELEGR